MRRARRVRQGSAARSGTDENVIWPVIYAREKKKQESLQMFSFTRLGNWITQSNVLFSSSASVAASSLRCARVFFLRYLERRLITVKTQALSLRSDVGI